MPELFLGIDRSIGPHKFQSLARIPMLPPFFYTMLLFPPFPVGPSYKSFCTSSFDLFVGRIELIFWERLPVAFDLVENL